MNWYEIFPKLLNMSLTASVIIICVLLVRFLLRRSPKIYSYILWTAVLFRLLCPVSISAPISLLGVFDAPVVESTKHTNMVEYIPSNIVHEEYPEVNLLVPSVSDVVNEALPQGWEQVTFDPLETSVTIATYLWMLGVAVMLGYSLISYFKLCHKLVGALCLHGNIYIADHITSSFVMGILQPRIYLSSTLEKKEQEYIILHEQYHIHRLDHIFKALAFLALCIHWFNPLVWVAFILSSKDMEMSCDEAVIKKMGEGVRADYSLSLLNLASGQRILFGIPLAFGEGDTKGRIKNLARWKKPTIWGTVAAAVVCVIVILVSVLNPEAEQLHAINAAESVESDNVESDGIETDSVKSESAESEESSLENESAFENNKYDDLLYREFEESVIEIDRACNIIIENISTLALDDFDGIYLYNFKTQEYFKIFLSMENMEFRIDIPGAYQFYAVSKDGTAINIIDYITIEYFIDQENEGFIDLKKNN